MSGIPSSAVDSDERFCLNCGYNLRGIGSERCPECGHAVDPTSLAISIIPWTHRRSIGGMRGYLRTVKTSILHSGKLAQEMGRPADFADAVLFRRVTAALATVSIIGLTACLVGISAPDMTGNLLSYRYEMIGVLFFWVCAWFFFLTIGGVASYWFHPASQPIQQQNRAIAISYYACGPLALTPIAVAMICAAILLSYLGDLYSHEWSTGGFDAIVAIGMCGGALLVSEFVLMLLSANRLLSRTTQCSGARSASCWIGLPISWIVLAGIFLVALPAVYCFIVLMILSFH